MAAAEVSLSDVFAERMEQDPLAVYVAMQRSMELTDRRTIVADQLNAIVAKQLEKQLKLGDGVGSAENDAARKKVVYCLDPVADATLRGLFPDYTLDIIGNVYVDNAMYTAIRYLVTEYMYDAFVVGTSVNYTGDFLTSAVSGRCHHHCCVVNTTAELVRYQNHVDELNALVTRTHVTTAAGQNIRKFAAGFDQFVCRRPSKCKASASFGLFDHTRGSPIPIHQVASKCIERGHIAAIGMFLYAPGILDYSEGELPCGVGSYFYEFDGNARKNIKFATCNSREMLQCMDFVEYERMLTASFVHVGDVLFAYEIVAIRGPIAVYRMCNLGSGEVPRSVDSRPLWHRHTDERYRVNTFKIVSPTRDPRKPTNYRPYSFTVPARLYNLAYYNALCMDKAKFTRQAVYDYLHVINQKCVISAADVVRPEAASAQDLLQLSIVVFVAAYQARFDQNRLHQELARSEQLAREIATAGLFRALIMASKAKLRQLYSSVVNSTVDTYVRSWVDACLASRDMVAAVTVEKPYTLYSQASDEETIVDTRLFNPALGGSELYRARTNPVAVLRRMIQNGLRNFDRLKGRYADVARAICAKMSDEYVYEELALDRPLIAIAQPDYYLAQLPSVDDYTGVVMKSPVPLYWGNDVSAVVYVFPEAPDRALSPEARALVQKILDENHHESDLVGRPGNLSVAFPVSSVDVTPEKTVLLAAPIQAMQSTYDEVFPGASERSRFLDQELIDVEDLSLSINVPGLRINIASMLKTSKRRVGFKPILRSAATPDRSPTTRDILAMIVKRNAAVQQSQDYYHQREMFETTLDAFKSGFCVPNVDQITAEYRKHVVTITPECVEDWVCQQKPEKVSMVSKACMTIDFADISHYSMMPKTRVKCSANGSDDVYQALQSVVYHGVVSEDSQPFVGTVNPYFSSIFRRIRERLFRILKPSVMLNMLKSVDDLEQFMSTFFLRTDNPVFLELDMSKYDKGQQDVCLTLEWMFYEWLGINIFDLAIWIAGHKRSTATNIPHGVKLFFDMQRRSGDATTALGNSIVNMLTMASTCDLSKARSILILGDDSLAEMESKIDVENLSKSALARFNLFAKPFQTRYPIFCGNFVVPNPNGKGYLLLPDPFRRYERLAVTAPADEEKIQDMYQSLADSCKNYKNAAALRALDEAVCYRYNCRSVAPMLHGLATVIDDYSEFRKLYSVNKMEMV